MIKTIISQLFPIDTISVVTRRRSTDWEVNGLPKDATPKNCQVLAMGNETHGNMSRTHYLVKVGNHVAYLTICLPEFGDSLFALIRGLAQAGTEEADDVCKHAKTSMSIVCASSSMQRQAA